jgi:hypothetical protein
MLTIALLLVSVGCVLSRNRIFIDFDTLPPGVTTGRVILMNGVSIGLAESAIVVQLERPKVRVPVTLRENIETLPNETIFQ